MLTSEIRQVPLHQLRDGADYPLGNINMRKGQRDEDLGPLRAALKDKGQLQNLVGTTYQGSDEVYLINGNRRRRASELNFDESPSLSLNNMDVRVYHDLTVQEALEIGLVEPMTALPPHELDQYEAFAALGEDDIGAIAAHFDCSVRLVKQRMKLGNLSSKIRNAFREGVINRQTAEAFTMGKDHKAQDRAFDKLLRTHSLFPHTVRAMLLGDQAGVPRLLHFASAEFVKAGGEIIPDLFGDDHGVSDTALLTQVADQKLADMVTFHGEGFAWAELASNLPSEWEGWPRLRIKAADPRSETVKAIAELKDIMTAEDSTPEERRAARVELKRTETWLLLKGVAEKKKADTGVVVVGIDGDGGLDVIYGVTRPAEESKRVLPDETSSDKVPDKNPPERAGKTAPTEEPSTLTLKSQSQRAVELTTAAAQVLANHPKAALIVLLAGFADRGSYGAIRASVSGSGANALELMASDDIATNIKRLATMKPAMLDKLLAQAAAAALVFQAHSKEHPAIEDKGTLAILNLLPSDELHKAIGQRFDAEDYFGKGLLAELALEAIRDNCGAIIASEQENKSGPELREFALANLKPGWLPPQLRGPGYTGPGAKKAKAAAKPTKGKTATKAKPAKKKK